MSKCRAAKQAGPTAEYEEHVRVRLMPKTSLNSAPSRIGLADAGCEPVAPFPGGSGGRTFLGDDAAILRMRLKYYRRVADGALIAKAWFGPGTQGPPGHAHGGSMASLLDEVMGGCAWMHGHAVLAAQLVTNFRNPLPLGSLVIAEGWITHQEGRKIHTKGRIFSEGGLLFAEGEALFIELTAAQLQKFDGGNFSAT